MGFISDQIWRGDMLLNSKCRVVCTCIGSGFQNSAVRTRTIYLCSLSSTSRLCFWYGYADVFNHKVTFWISVISVVVLYQSQFIIQYRSLALCKSAWQFESLARQTYAKRRNSFLWFQGYLAYEDKSKSLNETKIQPFFRKHLPIFWYVIQKIKQRVPKSLVMTDVHTK